MSFYIRVFGESEEDETYREEPSNLGERLFHSSVASGSLSGEPLKKFKAKKEPFLSLEREGWLKHHVSHDAPGGRKTVIHYWQSPAGERRHLKFKDD